MVPPPVDRHDDQRRLDDRRRLDEALAEFVELVCVLDNALDGSGRPTDRFETAELLGEIDRCIDTAFRCHRRLTATWSG